MSENISAQTTPTFKKSFFGDYFRYKLRTQRGYIILFAILNFISTAGFAAAVYFIAEFGFLPGIKDSYMYSTLGPSMMIMFLIWLMAITVLFEVVMLCILPAVSFKFFNKRSHMDTLGALPLTTSQRFLGDMLSGAAVFGISFVPEAVIAVIIAAITEAGPVREINELTDFYPYFPWKNESVLKIVRCHHDHRAVVLCRRLCHFLLCHVLLRKDRLFDTVFACYEHSACAYYLSDSRFYLRKRRRI